MATLTVEQIFDFMERVIAEDILSGNRAGLKKAQTAAGFLMAVANESGDKESGYRFRVLAAKAANKYEQLSGRE